MKNNSIRNVVATGIGAALFVVIGMLNIPTPIPNTSIQLQYALQALFSLVFGPLVGFLTGFIGHSLKDVIQYGNPWWTWVFSSGLFGLIMGLFQKQIHVSEGFFKRKDIVIFNLVQVAANILVWLVISPLGDVLIYKEAAGKVFAQGLVATILNSLTVGIAGTLLLAAYAGTRTKKGSLTKD